MISAVGVCAQTTPATAGGTQLTAEQKNLLSEAVRLSQQVVQLNASGKFDEAMPLAKRAVELRRSVYGDNHQLVADGLSNIAALHFGNKRYDQAESLYKEALASYDGASITTQNTAYVLDSLTSLRWRVRDYNKAEHYGKRAIDAREKLFGAKSPRVLESVQNLIKVYESDGKETERNALYLRVLTLSEDAKDITGQNAQSLVAYHCWLSDAKQTPDADELKKRIENLLGWRPGTQANVLTGGVLNGRALSLPKPAYPIQAREARVAGQVVVQVEIDECGKVIDAQVLSGPIELRSTSLVSAKNARFTPTLIGKHPFKVRGIIHYNFVRQ